MSGEGSKKGQCGRARQGEGPEHEESVHTDIGPPFGMNCGADAGLLLGRGTYGSMREEVS